MTNDDLGPDLPLELIQAILIHLPKVHYLTQTALVNLAFYQSTIPLLYNRVSINPWYEKKSKVIQLFRTLSSNTNLARYIRRLEIKYFPKDSFPDDFSKLILQGLRNCTNLRSCWTQTPTSDILLALLNPSPSLTGASSSPSPLALVHQLRELEINGSHSNLYDPKLLLNFNWLERISIIMPTVEFVKVLEDWVKVVQGSLKSLDVFCNTSTVITNNVLIRMAPSLRNLESFHLTGCRRVTHKGICAVLTENKNGMQNLRLEGVSSRLDLTQLLPTSASISQPPTLRNLHSLILSIPLLDPERESLSTMVIQGDDLFRMTMLVRIEFILSNPRPWLPTVQSYISALSEILTHHVPKLEKIQICGPCGFLDPSSEISRLLSRLVKTHRERLKRISVHRMDVDLEVIKDICVNCSALEELFIAVEPDKLNILADYVHYARSLKTIHVDYSPRVQFTVFVLSPDKALEFIKRCDNPGITQFGCESRVWFVNRKVVVGEDRDGNEKMECEIDLGPYESLYAQEQFMVVRTCCRFR